MQKLLVQRRNPNLRAYFVWGAYLRGDTVDMAQAASQRFMAPNAAYYWTPTQKLSQDLGITLRLAGGRAAWDVYLMYGKGAIWESRFPEPAFWQHLITGNLQADPLDPSIFGARVEEYLSK
jgi:hypothetical protein